MQKLVSVHVSSLQVKKWTTRIAFCSGIVFLLLLLNGATSKLQAQLPNPAIPNIDGSPAEWPAILNYTGYGSKGFKHDPFNANGIDNQWTGGSQDGDASPSANWHWVYGNSNDKGDIGNAGAVLINKILYFFGDRSAIQGDAQIGFWFFKDNVQPIGDGKRSSPFSGEHTNGDLLIISNFTNGGGQGAPAVYEWQNKTASNPGGPVLLTLQTAPAFLTTNSGTVASPDGTSMFNGETWTFKAKGATNTDYLKNLFFEGYVDLTNIPEASCFQRFVLETRNSASIGASLQDLTAGNFGARPGQPVVTITEANLCGTETAPSLTVNCPVAATYKLTQTGETPITKVYPTDAVAGVLKFTGLKDGKGFEIYADANGCRSDTTDCTNYSTLSCPTAGAIARPSSSIETATVQLSSDLKVLATPNPYNNKIRFSLESPMTGDGTLELYNMLGQKVKTVYQGHFEKGQAQIVDYKVTGAQRSNLVYVFRVGNQKTTGKLVGMK